MANKGTLDLYINALPDEIRVPIRAAFYYIADNWRIGNDDRADNAQLYRFLSTTASVANQEFTIAHHQNVAPSKLIPMLDLTSSGGTIPPLTVSRAADASNIYLRSSSTSAPFLAYVEF